MTSRGQCPPQAKRGGKTMSAEKILVVDDETNICELLKLYLEKEGYEVYTANNGADAVNVFKEVDKRIYEGILKNESV